MVNGSIISEEQFLRIFLFLALGRPVSHIQTLLKFTFIHLFEFNRYWLRSCGSRPLSSPVRTWFFNLVPNHTGKWCPVVRNKNPLSLSSQHFVHFPDQIMWWEFSINQDGASTWRRRSRERTCCRCYKRLYFTAKNQWVIQNCHTNWILSFDCLLSRYLLTNSSRIYAHRDQLLARLPVYVLIFFFCGLFFQRIKQFLV